jgi:GTP-binding protein
MPVAQVVIVGRPNVGKSSLFNWLVGKRVAVVDDTPGVTRDRVTYLMCVRDTYYFELVDTGGMGIEDADNLTEKVEDQIELALADADVVLFVVDTLSGLTPLDQEVAKRLRYIDVPIICVANKTDSPKLDPAADEFYKLGRGKLVKVSTKAGRGKDELMHLILDRLPKQARVGALPPEEPVMKLAIVGRRNVGKSTFVNTLAQAERMIVSEIPGTTRDSVDVRFELDAHTFLAIDTPGLRRPQGVKSDIDFYSLHRAQRSVRRADVVLLFFDAQTEISRVDKQLAAYVTEQYKPCVFVVNKWDLKAGTMPTEKWVNYLRDNFRTMGYAPIAFITGQTGKNVKALLNHAQMLFKQSRSRVGTPELNQVIQAALAAHQPPARQGRQPRIYYGTQAGIAPPTIVLFCNNPDGFDHTYRRYLLGVFRERLPFGEVPIKLYLRRREGAVGDGDGERAGGQRVPRDEASPRGA